MVWPRSTTVLGETQTFIDSAGSVCLAGVLCSNASFSLCCLTNTSVQSCRLMNTCHVFAHDCDACMSLQSEPVALKVSRWRLRHFLSPYCQMLLGCCLHWFIRSGKQCPSSAHQHTPMTQPGLKVGTEPTASIRTVTLKSFLVPPFDK